MNQLYFQVKNVNHLISIPCLSAVIETFKDQLSPKLRQLFNFIHAKDEDAFDHLMQWSEWTRMLIYVSAGESPENFWFFRRGIVLDG